MKNALKKRILVILILSVLLSVVLFMAENVFTDSNALIVRNGYGEGEKVAEYEVKVEGETGSTLKIDVGELEYTSEEIRKIFDEIIQELDEIILGENESFDRVEKDLNLVTEVEGYPVQIEWQMDSYLVLNLYGEIQEKHLKEEGTQVELRGTLSYRGEEAVYVQHVRVFPITRKGADKFFYEIGQQVKCLEQETRQQSSFSLPGSYEGKKLTWTQKKENRWYYALLLGIAFCVYQVYREKEQERKNIMRRKEELLRDYPGLVSKFTMLLGTGTTVRNAWEKIVQNYEGQREVMGKQTVYEEMEATLREIQGGVSEAEAYEKFGRRCDVTTYVKFGTLLSQNLRKGSRGLSDILRMEAIQSFENRKSTARRLGEEAGTKLLMPMLGMLAVVFIIVMIPAFLSM